MPEQVHPEWHKALSETEAMARSGRLGRMMRRPFRYMHAMFFRHLVFPRTNKPKVVQTETFFGETLSIPLPACTDIYLTGGKSHDSEIRLARFLLQMVREGDMVMDLGAHIGFFTRFLAALCGGKGKVIALEPSAGTFALLQENTRQKKNILALESAAGAEEGTVSFFEFESSHSEYSSTDASQYAGAEWFEQHRPVQRTVPCVTIDGLCLRNQLHPILIKIDVEGGELNVIRGASECLKQDRPALVMEFHPEGPNRSLHLQTLDELAQIGYRPFTITAEGNLRSFRPEQTAADSDNIVLLHPGCPRKIPGSGY